MDAVRWLLAVVIAALLSAHGFRKKSLDRSGAAAAFVVGLVSFGAGYRIGLQLLVFYGVSSRLTRVGSKQKRKLEDEHREGGQRNYEQVLSNSVCATIAAILYLVLVGGDDVAVGGAGRTLATRLFAGIVAHYSCCAGDTWSSELGILARTTPRLVIAPWRTVPPGTNGGVTPTGLAASAGAGLLQGLVAAAMAPLCAGASLRSQGGIVALAVAAGIGGSLLDSVLGATCQSSWFDRTGGKVLSSARTRALTEADKARKYEHITGADLLTNDQVNLVTAAVSTVAGAAVAPLFL